MMVTSNQKLKIIVLSPSLHSVVTKEFVKEVRSLSGIKLGAVVFRKIGGLTRLREELKIGIFSLVFKVLNKLVRPIMLRIFGTNEKYIYEDVELKFVQNFNSDESLKWIQARSPDLIVFTGGGILKKELLAASKLGVLNCHLGVLPQYRGMYPYIWAILDDQWGQIGCTTHLMDIGIDTGPIINVFKFDFTSTNCVDLGARLEKKIPGCLISSLKAISLGNCNPSHQLESDGKQYFIPHKVLVEEATKKIEQRKKNV